MKLRSFAAPLAGAATLLLILALSPLSASAAPSSPPVPNTPSDVTATALASDEIEVTWADSSPNVLGYNIDNGCPVGYSGCKLGDQLDLYMGPEKFAIFTVAPGTYDCFRVAAYNATGYSGFSSYGCATSPS